MTSVGQALELVLRVATPLAAESVALEEALARVLREDVAADRDLPPFDRAAMDGYAVRAADTAAAPVALELAGEVRAGEWPSARVAPGQAVRIMTGAPLPEGATAVQQVEKTRPLDEFRVTVEVGVVDGQNVAPRGSEVRQGALVLAAGRLVDPAAIGVLAAVGRARVSVGRRPRVALLVTGDELVDVADTPGPAQIRNSNGPALCAAVRAAGGVPRTLGVAADRKDAIEAALAEGLESDVLIASGGVSAGDYDLVEPALTALGVELLFTRVEIKPGAPLVFGRRGATLVFGLPGNPVSSQVTFELFVRPALLRLQGARAPSRPRVPVDLAAEVRNRSGRAYYLPARVRGEDGRLRAWPVATRGSGDLVAHAKANALVLMAAERGRAAAGEAVEATLLGRFAEDEDGQE